MKKISPHQRSGSNAWCYNLEETSTFFHFGDTDYFKSVIETDQPGISYVYDLLLHQLIELKTSRRFDHSALLDTTLRRRERRAKVVEFSSKSLILTCDDLENGLDCQNFGITIEFPWGSGSVQIKYDVIAPLGSCYDEELQVLRFQSTSIAQHLPQLRLDYINYPMMASKFALFLRCIQSSPSGMGASWDVLSIVQDFLYVEYMNYFYDTFVADMKEIRFDSSRKLNRRFELLPFYDLQSRRSSRLKRYY